MAFVEVNEFVEVDYFVAPNDDIVCDNTKGSVHAAEQFNPQ